MPQLLVLIAAAWAGQVQLEVDRRTLQVGESLSLYLTFLDVNPGVPPRLPAVEGLAFDYQGLKFSTVWANGQSVDTVTFLYSMTALTPGQHTLPALELRAGGEVLRTQALVIEARPRAALAGQDRITAALMGGQGPVQEAWVGQTLVYHMEFATQQRLLDRRWTAPAFEGLMAEQTLEAQVREYDSRLDGQAWSHLSLDQPLVVTASGSRSVSPGVLAVQVPDPSGARTRGMRVLSGVRNEVFSTESLPLSARELPAAGRAPDFSGLVGQFTLEARLLDDAVALGESATLELTLRGDGTLSGFTLPKPPPEAGLTAYDDAPVVQASVQDGRFFTQATFRRALVPEAEGELEVPPVQIQVFDPVAGVYTTLQTPPLRLRVSPGQADPALSTFTAATGDGRLDVRDQGDDILPVHTPVQTRSGLFDPRAPGPLALVGVPWLAFAGLWLWGVWTRLRPPADPRRALARRLGALEGATVGEVEAVLGEALGLALGVAPGTLTREALRGLPAEHVQEALALYDALQTARYGGGSPGGLGARARRLGLLLLEGR